MPSMSQRIRKIVPKKLINLIKPGYHSARSLRYSMFLKSRKISKSRMLILGTPGRSGTHYMRFLFANYLRLLGGTSDGPTDSNTMNSMLPNKWHDAYFGERNYRDPTPELSLIGLDDLAYTHANFLNLYWNDSKVLHIYRNPLDFCVSIYFFRYKYRTSFAGAIADPVEAMDDHLEEYAANYRSYREAAGRGNSNILRVSYEDLITFPAPTFRMILRWLGVEANIDLVEIATQYSSKESMRIIEDRDGPIDSVIDVAGGRFVRDGSIGQWKKYFKPKDLELAQSKLERFGVNLNEFTLEA
jgi:hypothetical protein